MLKKNMMNRIRVNNLCWSQIGISLIITIVSGITGCSLSDLVGQSEVPAGTSDPAVIASEAGALGLYYGSIQKFATAVSEYVVKSGLLGDELRPANLRNQIGEAGLESAIDSRYLPGVGQTTLLARYQDVGDGLYAALQAVRGAVRQARGGLLAYAPLTSPALRGHLYAIEGYAEIFLADLYCSGIPLSTLDFDGDYTLKPGSLTTDVYKHAIVLFDSAIALSVDSVRIRDLARIGKARALIALGEYDAIPALVSGIATTYIYSTSYSGALPNQFKRETNFTVRLNFTISDGEGPDETGVKYVSLADPRVILIKRGADNGIAGTYSYNEAMKYDSTGRTPIIIASGTEAQLMQAEAELHVGGAWLETLNKLRTSCTDTTTCPTPAPAGTGGISGLSPINVSGASIDDKIALLFEERALWLFLTGHRQGDMRRLLRNYRWPEDRVYATGEYYLNNAAGMYGESVNFPIAKKEELSNPLFRGCSNRDA